MGVPPVSRGGIAEKWAPRPDHEVLAELDCTGADPPEKVQGNGVRAAEESFGRPDPRDPHTGRRGEISPQSPSPALHSAFSPALSLRMLGVTHPQVPARGWAASGDLNSRDVQ